MRHSVEYMDWIAGSRLHFLEPLVTRTLVLIPAFILSITKEPLTFISFRGIPGRVDPFKHPLGPRAAVRYHRWHRSSGDEAIDKNYVAHLTAIDWIFGTFYMPRDSSAWPRKYGTVGIPLPT